MQKRMVARALRLGLPLLTMGACLWALTGLVEAQLWGQMPRAMAQVPPQAVATAFFCTLISFWAVGRYDAVAHRHLRSGVSAGRGRLSGTIAIALSQTLGFGIFTGALARWRMIPDIGMPTALRLSGFVCLSFMVALAVVLATACVFLPAPAGTFWPALAVLLSMPFLALALLVYPCVTVRGHRYRLPSLVACGAIGIWTLLDTAAAAAALYVLVPDLGLNFAAFLPIFLIALAAALLSGSPGGVGPFELVLLTLCPASETAAILSGIVIYRAIYYACPAIVAMVALTRPFAPQTCQTPRPVPTLADAPRAEIGVIRQNGGRVLAHASGASAVVAQGQSLVALFDPISGKTATLLPGITASAMSFNLLPVLYKTSARSAVAARRSGWHIIHIADEACLCPPRFDIAVPARAALRRKLRKAEKLGVRVLSHGALPLSAMARIDVDWQRRKGGARGATMGRFSPAYIGAQKVFCAWQDTRLVGFVTFHASRHEWCLDLMRAREDAPDGTMHALVHAALIQAAAQGIPRLSLAATPACPDPSSALMRRISTSVSRHAGGPGLRQFKSGFAPDWAPLYAAAPTRFGLALGLIDIALAVRRAEPPAPHQGDEDYEVAARLAS